MSALQQFTVVLVVDTEHAAELAIAWPTWVHFHPEILQVPLIVYVDAACENSLAGRIDGVLNHPDVRYIRWNHRQSTTQREKMLSAFVLDAPFQVETPYWMKIDTDVIATAPGPLVRDEWLGHDPVLIAQRWGYTKPADMIERLSLWAHSKYGRFLHDAPIVDVVDGKAKHRRIISYVCGIGTQWSQSIARLCNGKMPVPSQDTLHWYCARCNDEMIRTVDMKAMGWRHVGSRGLDKLAAAAAESMNAKART
jgi:hypothetical protein